MPPVGGAVCVAVSTAIRWVTRYRMTGSLAPARIGGYRRKSITGDERDWLIARCRGGAFALRGLVVELAERGLAVDYRTVCRFVNARRAQLIASKLRLFTRSVVETTDTTCDCIAHRES